MRIQPKILAVCLLLAGIFLAPNRAQAQSVNAAVHGAVTDPTGAVVPGATVTALNTSTGVSTVSKTDGTGYYIFPALLIGGPYTITVSHAGFQDFQSTGLMLNVNANREVDAKLKVGAASQTVKVKAAAVQVETSDTQLKTVVGEKEIEDLPLLSRNADELEKTAPGVVESSDRFGTFSANGSQTSETSFLLDGTDINDAPLQTAGVVPNPDALAEFNVITSTLNPEFSRNSGAIINEILKSGTNQIHGSGFEFYRDTFLNNGNYFSIIRPQYHQNEYGGTLGGPIYKNHAFFFLAYQGLRNRTGVTNLTPVPAAGQLNSGNFTNDTNQASSSLNSAGLSSNPIPFNMQGTNGPCVADPTATNPETWADCFPVTNGQVVVSPSNYNSIANNLAKAYVPAPNQVRGGKSFYNFNAGNTQALDQGIIRLDDELTKNDALWFSTIFQSAPTTETLPFIGSTLPGFGEIDARHIKIFNASYTHTFNPSMLNELRVGYYRFNFAAVEPQKIVQPSSLGFTGITPQSPSAGAPYMGLTGFFALGFSQDGPQPRKDSNYDYTDNFSKIAGNHNLKFGAHVEKFYVGNPFYYDNNGAFGYSGTGVFSSGDPLIDFMTGIPDSYSQNSGGLISALAWEDYLYAQDNWKVNDTLTLNYGMGYDLETPFANYQYGGIGIFCWAPTGQSKVFPTAPPGLLYPGDPGCNKNGGDTIKYKNFAPRFGFAWSPDSGLGSLTGGQGQHLFALRGGFGIYYNRDQEEGSLQNLSDAPFGLGTSGATDVGGSPAFANPFQDVANRPGLSEPNKFPFVPPAQSSYSSINFNNYEPMDINSISPTYAVPYTANYNLNVQRSLPSNMVLMLGYVGSLGMKLIRAYEADQMTAAGHAACVANPTCYAVRAFTSAVFPQYFTQPGVNSAGNPYYYSVGRQHTDGHSNYNSFQAQLTKETSHGLYFTLAYTYSHGLDNASGYESSYGGGGPGGAGTNWVPGFQYLSYGDSDYDARHRFVALYNYEIPILHNMNDNFIVREALGGWHVTGTTTLQTGFPVGVFQGGNNRSLWCNGSFVAYYGCNDVPETSTYNIPSLNPRASGNYWFSSAPFSTEPLGTFGNVKRNFFHGPGFEYTNLELYKNFPLGPQGTPRYIELRLETYNTFNHANFANPDGNFSDGSQFGQITNVIQPGTGDPQPGRAVQLGAKVYF